MEKKALLLTIGSVLFISFGSIFIRLSSAPALTIAFYRMFFSVLLLLPLMKKRDFNELKSINKKTLYLCMFSGLFLALHFATWITSLSYTTVASSTVLVSMHPIIILIIKWLYYQKKINSKIAISVFVTFVGSAVISYTGFGILASGEFLGNGLAFAGAIAVSFYILIGEKVRQEISVNSYTFIVYLMSSFFLLIFVTLGKRPLVGFSLKQWLLFLALAVFCNLLGHSIFNWALGYLDSSLVSIIIISEPIFASIWAIFIFNEIPKVKEIIGGLLIIGGIVYYIRTEKQLKKEKRKKDEVVCSRR
jgi:drug/metabolite transporter (DMT)-like permease